MGNYFDVLQKGAELYDVVDYLSVDDVHDEAKPVVMLTKPDAITTVKKCSSSTTFIPTEYTPTEYTQTTYPVTKTTPTTSMPTETMTTRVTRPTRPTTYSPPLWTSSVYTT